MGSSSTLHIFISVLCDNLLLTVVVPILPELLRNDGANVAIQHKPHIFENATSANSYTSEQHLSYGNETPTTGVHNNGHGTEDNSQERARDCLRRLFHLRMLHENSQLGILFSTKALLQLFANPLVGRLTFKVGYKIPLCIGNFILFLCSLVFAFANSYGLFVVGRSVHGLASALINVSGMALIAEAHPVDEERTRFLGRLMGAAALGVLLGYPFGGITFSLFGKLVPFLGIATIAIINVVFQITKIEKYDLVKSFNPEEQTQLLDEGKINMMPTTLCMLFKDRSIKIISIAVWLSTTAMAVLEPTLPVWLIENMNPPKWQLGLVFVPDSLGYFIGTNCLGGIALRFGRWKVSMISLAAIGVACFMLPMAGKIWELAFPHFSLGLALGAVDASLMPLLARIADDKYHAGYGAIYALAQTSVALAYSLGPLFGGELVPVIGFPDLIRSIGFLNLLFCPFLFLLSSIDLSPVSIHDISSDEDYDCRRDGINGETERVYQFDASVYNKQSSARNKTLQSIRNEVAILGDLLPLKSYDNRYVQYSESQLSYQRFHDQCDSD